MLLVDIHAHLDFKEFEEDLDEVIERAEQVGVKAIINNTTNTETIKKAKQITKKYKIIKLALGLHPIYLDKLSEKQIQETLKLIEETEAISIGEIGLDYHHNKENKEKQKQVFRKVLQIAQKRSLPVIIHSRESVKDALPILAEYPKLKVIMHCFQGRKSQIKECLNRGYYFSIPPSITRNPIFQYMAQKVPLNKLLTETDSPYQGPEKQERNEPANVKTTITHIAKAKGLTEQETANIIFQNYRTLF